MNRFVFLLLSSAFVAACGGNTDSDQDQSDDELRNGGISEISVEAGTGFRPPPQPGSCWASGRWSVDFASKLLSADACIDGQQRTVSRELTSAEFTRVKTAVAAIRTTRRPQACPTDIPVRAVTVKKGRATTRYVEERAACGGSGTPAVTEGIEAVVQLMNDLSTVAEPEPAGEKALGLLQDPGSRLNGETFEIKQGASLSFESSENQIRCIRDISIDPEEHVALEEKVVTPREDGLLGGSTQKKRTFTVAESAPAGTVVKVTSTSCFQVRDDAAWNLDFKIKIKAR